VVRLLWKDRAIERRAVAAETAMDARLLFVTRNRLRRRWNELSRPHSDAEGDRHR
jgi:hypothetical protein